MITVFALLEHAKMFCVPAQEQPGPHVLWDSFAVGYEWSSSEYPAASAVCNTSYTRIFAFLFLLPLVLESLSTAALKLLQLYL